MSAVFITATGTDIGKTHVACALIRTLRDQGIAVSAFKPAQSGFDGLEGSDAGRLLEALGRPASDLDAIAPLRFSAPLAPPSAARAEGKQITLAAITALCREATAAAEGLLLIEGAGGVMSPIADDATNLDLICDLGAPAILLCGSYLGAISHTLTAVETLWARGVAISAIVVSENENAPPITEITDALATFAPYIPVVVAPRAATWDATPLCALL